MADPRQIPTIPQFTSITPEEADANAARAWITQHPLIQKLVNYFTQDPASALPGPMMLETPVYHGTNQVFDQFINSKLAKDTLYGVGHYFTDSPEVASGYALNKATWTPQIVTDNANTYDANLMKLKDKMVQLFKKGPDQYQVVKNVKEPGLPNVHKVYLDIDTPFDVDKDVLSQEELKKLGIKSKSGNLNDIKKQYPGIEEKFPDMLNKLGYDSLVYSGGSMSSGVTPHRVFVVNNPDKIIPNFPQVVADKFMQAKNLIK